MRNFRNYDVWKDAIELVSRVYQLTETLPVMESFSLTKQMRRAAVSIPSNLAEGCSRGSEKEFKHFIEVSLGSAFELETQLIIADNLFGINQTSLYPKTFELLSKVQAELNALRNRLN